MPEEPISQWTHLVKNEKKLKINIFIAKDIKFKTSNIMLYSDCIKRTAPEIHSYFY